MKKTKTSIAVDEKLWRAFGAQVRLLGMDYSECIDTLIRQFLESISAGSVPKMKDYSGSFNPRNKRQHKLLEIILESQTPGARTAIMHNLRMFGYTVSVAGAKSDKELDRDIDILLEQNERDDEDEDEDDKPRPPRKR